MRDAGCRAMLWVAGWFRWIAASLALLAMTNWAEREENVSMGKPLVLNFTQLDHFCLG
jgi:hypothetical protein